MISIDNIYLLSFIGIGTVSIFKKMYNVWNLNNIIKELEINTQISPNNYFVVDIIDLDCDGNVLFFIDNMLNRKGIKWGKYGEIKYLKSFKNHSNILIYEFDDDYKLIITSSNRDKFIYSFQTKDRVIVKSIEN